MTGEDQAEIKPTHCQAEPRLATKRINTVLSKKVLIYHKDFTLESHNLAFSPLSLFNFVIIIYFYSVVCANAGKPGKGPEKYVLRGYKVDAASQESKQNTVFGNLHPLNVSEHL